MEYFAYKVQLWLLTLKIWLWLLTFPYSQRFFSTISLHCPNCLKPSMAVLSQILCEFANFSEFVRMRWKNATKTFSYRKHLRAYQRKLKMVYNRRHFLKVLYFFLNKIGRSCNDGNWFASAEITLLHSCSSNLI